MKFVYELIEMFGQYKLKYDVPTKTLVCKSPMLVTDLVEIRKLIEAYRLPINEIRIVGR